MDRRTLVVGGGTTAAAIIAATTAPHLVLASPVPRSVLDIARDERVLWGPDTMTSPHAEMVAEWIKGRISARVLPTHGSGSILTDYDVQLSDPRFFVKADRPVWNWMTGDTEESGLSVYITERGVPLGRTYVITSKGHDTYWNGSSTRNYPDYSMRGVYLDDEAFRAAEEALPQGHITWSHKLFSFRKSS